MEWLVVTSSDYSDEECTLDISSSESDSIDDISESETESDSDTNISDARQWSSINNRDNLKPALPRFPFYQTSGMTFIVQNNEDPLEYLEKVFNEAMM